MSMIRKLLLRKNLFKMNPKIILGFQKKMSVDDNKYFQNRKPTVARNFNKLMSFN